MTKFFPEETGCVAYFNSSYDINMLYPSNSVSKFPILFPFCLLKFSFFQWNRRDDFLIICIVYPKWHINISQLSIWEPLIYQLLDVIGLINTKPNKILKITIIYVFKDRSFLNFDLKYSSKNLLGYVQAISSFLIFRTLSLDTVR